MRKTNISCAFYINDNQHNFLSLSGTNRAKGIVERSKPGHVRATNPTDPRLGPAATETGTATAEWRTRRGRGTTKGQTNTTTDCTGDKSPVGTVMAEKGIKTIRLVVWFKRVLLN